MISKAISLFQMACYVVLVFAFAFDVCKSLLRLQLKWVTISGAIEGRTADSTDDDPQLTQELFLKATSSSRCEGDLSGVCDIVQVIMWRVTIIQHCLHSLTLVCMHKRLHQCHCLARLWCWSVLQRPRSLSVSSFSCSLACQPAQKWECILFCDVSNSTRLCTIVHFQYVLKVDFLLKIVIFFLPFPPGTTCLLKRKMKVVS